MKNLSLQRIAVYGGMVVFWLALILVSTGAFAQTWQNVGNGYQSKVVGGFRDLRVVFTTGNAPYGVTDSLNKKLNITDTLTTIATKSDLASKVTAPNPLIPSIVLGTTLSTNVLGMVGYSQSPMGDQLAMYNFGGQLSTANPIDATDAVNKQSLETSLTGYQLLSEKAIANGYASLDGGGKIPASQLPNSIMELQGKWNAATNTPTLVNNTGNPGDIYEVTTAGTQNLGSGDIVFAVGDFAVYGADGSWFKSINSNAVTSVNGLEGTVNLTTTNIPEGTNLYYTEARVNANGNLLHTTGNETKNGNLTINGEFLQTRTGKQVVIDAGEVVTNDLTTSAIAVLKGTGSISLGVTTPHSGDISPPSGGFTAARTQRMQDATGVLALTSNFATGQTIGANTTGNAATATNSTKWNNYTLDVNAFSSGADLMFGRTANQPEARLLTQAGVRTFLGLGSNAYTSTAYLPLTGGSISGGLTIANAPVNPTDVVRKQELDLKASLASPALTGTPTAPTPSAVTNNSQIATTQFVGTAIINRRKNTVSVTSGSAAVIQSASIYTFSSSASGCNLPSIASSGGWEVLFINRASGSITFNSNAGGNDIDQAGVLSSTMTLATGDSMTMVNNGVSWVVIK